MSEISKLIPKSELTIISPIKSNSQYIDISFVSYIYGKYTTTPLFFPIFFTDFNINALERYGIFFPLVEILSEYNLYNFSCLFPGLNFNIGFDFSELINLKIVSSGTLNDTGG